MPRQPACDPAGRRLFSGGVVREERVSSGFKGGMDEQVLGRHQIRMFVPVDMRKGTHSHLECRLFYGPFVVGAAMV